MDGEEDEETKKRITNQAIRELAEAVWNIASKSGWEGDIREGVYVGALPVNEPETTVYYALKQDNNGTTYIASPKEVTWLRDYICN